MKISVFIHVIIFTFTPLVSPARLHWRWRSSGDTTQQTTDNYPESTHSAISYESSLIVRTSVAPSRLSASQNQPVLQKDITNMPSAKHGDDSGPRSTITHHIHSSTAAPTKSSVVAKSQLMQRLTEQIQAFWNRLGSGSNNDGDDNDDVTGGSSKDDEDDEGSDDAADDLEDAVAQRRFKWPWHRSTKRTSTSTTTAAPTTTTPVVTTGSTTGTTGPQCSSSLLKNMQTMRQRLSSYSSAELKNILRCMTYLRNQMTNSEDSSSATTRSSLRLAQGDSIQAKGMLSVG